MQPAFRERADPEALPSNRSAPSTARIARGNRSAGGSVHCGRGGLHRAAALVDLGCGFKGSGPPGAPTALLIRARVRQ